MRIRRYQWRQMAGMRNRVIHGYDVIDLGIVWDTVQNDLPALKSELRKIIDSLPGAAPGSTQEQPP
jgi:uncharacterized protein with HEPN domain